MLVARMKQLEKEGEPMKFPCRSSFDASEIYRRMRISGSQHMEHHAWTHRTTRGESKAKSRNEAVEMHWLHPGGWIFMCFKDDVVYIAHTTVVQ